MRRESVFSSIALFVLVLIASVHSQSVPEPRLDDATSPESNLDGSTITVTPSSSYDVYCYSQGIQKNWYSSGTSISRDTDPGHNSNVYVRRITDTVASSEALALYFEFFRPSDIGEYECRITTARGQPTSTLSIYLTTPPPTPTPTPMLPSKVQSVTITRTLQGSSPALRVSWSTVSGSGITYTVCYSTTSGTQSDPPSGADCGASGITGTSTTLGSLSGGTTYYIWVAAVSSGGRGPYSDRRQERTYRVPSRVNPPSLTKTVRSGKPAIRVTWNAPSSDRPITKYQVQYRRSGRTNWRGMDATSTSTTLVNLSAGTSYQVQVRAVSEIGVGSYSEIRTITTYRVPGPVSNLSYQITSDTSAKIMWSEPEEPNGVIQGYGVTFGVYGDYCGHTMESVSSTMKELMNLSPETPINVTVQAKNTVGLGKPNSITLFTKEGVPTVAPKNVIVVRINSTTISVSWNPLTLHEARGWPVYMVFWERVSQRTTRAVPSINTSGSSVVIGNLDPASYYSVVVQVSTAAGTSEELKSQPVILDVTKNRLDADSDSSSVGLSAGLFIAGLVSGVIAVLLVEGIICGLCKISKMPQKKNIEGDYADPTNMQMTECPAYESIDREGKSAERVYEDIGSRDTKGH